MEMVNSTSKALFFLFLVLSLPFFARAAQPDLIKKTDSVMLAIPDTLTYSTQDIADYINSRFGEIDEKLLATYTWLAKNIDYDPGEQRDFMPLDELPYYIAETLHKRVGICQAYAEVFHDICNKMDINSQVVSGLVVPEIGRPSVSHAWIAAYASSAWQLIDPTFGAGYVSEGRFVKEFDTTYFNIHPDSLIQTHYPFDPAWQLKLFPVTMHEFFGRKGTQDLDKPQFHYSDTIDEYLSLSNPGRLISERRRIMAYGAEDPILDSYLDVLDQQIDFFILEKNIDLYDQSIHNYNLAVEIYTRNLQNPDLRNLPDESKYVLRLAADSAQILLRKANVLLTAIESDDERFGINVISMKHSISSLLKDVGEKVKLIQ